MSNNIAVVGLQWGDEGKGKVIDFLSDKFDIVIRFQGGHNAGHTIKVDDKTYKLSLLPSGVVRSKLGVIGNGVVLDPVALFKEIEQVRQNGVQISPENLYIADNCCLILSVHREIDQIIEAKKAGTKIGTTGRGIGPAYEDKVARRAIRICDLEDEEILLGRVEEFLVFHNALRRGLELEEVSVESILAEINAIRSEILQFAKAPAQISQLAEGKKVMFEGAQGVLLDNDHGTYPFVTSSNTIAGQATIGSCLGRNKLHSSLGILKSYCTRVGSGPFPSELKNEIGEHLKVKGAEIGTVTGRDRRCGWLDIVTVRQAIEFSGVESIVLTKLDVLDELETIKICVAYEYQGQTYDFLPSSIKKQEEVNPIYEEMPGWQESTMGYSDINQLPQKAIDYVKKIEQLCKVKVDIISTGPKRSDSIIVNKVA